MSVVFNKKAIVLYGNAQLADGVSVINYAPTGTISVTAGSAIVTGTGTQFLSEVAPHSYLYQGGTASNIIIGRVKSVNSNTSITLYSVIPAAAVSPAPKVMGQATTYSGTWHTGLGPENALAVLDATFSTNYETEEYVFTGDELDRTAVTSIKDFYGNLDFSVLMPVLGNITQTRVLGTGTIISTTGSDVVTVTSVANIMVNDYLYSLSGVLIGRVLSIAGLNLTLTGSAGIALSGKGYRIGKNNSTPAYDDMPLPDWFQAAGFSVVLAPGSSKVTNSISSNAKMTIEVRLSSPDLPLRQQKVYTLTDVRGTIDLDATIGSYGKMPFKFMGNLPPAPSQRVEIVPVYGSKKIDLAETISDLSITLSALGSYVAKIQVDFSPTSLAAGETVSIGGLTYTSTAVTTRAQLVALFSDIAIGTAAADLPIPATGTWTGSLLNYYTEGFSSTAVIFYSPGQAGNIATLNVDGGTGPVPSVTVISNNAEPPVPSVNNICFKQLQAPNVSGFNFTRFMRSCGRGWDKEAQPSDVTLSILEDAANADYVPEKNLAKHHSFNLFYGNDINNRRVAITFHDVILQKITNTTQDNSRGQDLIFRNTGYTDITFS